MTEMIDEKPQRIQRKRTKGWRIPPNTVYVGRGTRWGNQFRVGDDGSAAQCVRTYSDTLFPYRHHGPMSGMEHFLISEANMREVQADLRGKNLACWCPLDQPCHADVLLEMANV